MRKRSKPETVLQARIVAAISIAFPSYITLRTNSGSIQKGSRRIVLMPKGFFDLFVLRPRRVPAGIEVKRIGEEPKPEQLAWRVVFEALGYPHAVVYSQQQALDFLARCT